MATPLLVAAVADAACPPSLPLPWQARCGYITRGGRGGWRSARAAVSLSNSPSSRGGCAEPAGENWVSTGLGAGGRRGSPARGRGRGGRASGLRERGAGWAPRELPGVPVSHRSPSPAESPAPLIAGRRCPPPVQGIALHPGFFGVRTCRGGQSPAGAGARTPQPPLSSTPALLPGRALSSWGVPSFPVLSPWGAERDGRSIPTGIGAGGGCFPAVASAAGAGEAPRQAASLVTGRLSAGCSSFLPWSRGLCGLRVMCWKAPESLER